MSERAGLPAAVEANPVIGRWLRFDPDGYVELRTGKVEIGQGIMTALAQVAADELDIPVEQVKVSYASTAVSPDEGLTAGSRSVEQSGAAIRHVCAEARALFLAAASEALTDPAGEFNIEQGRIRSASSGEETTYWALADSVDLNREVTGRAQLQGSGPHTGVSVGRPDLAAKVRGQGSFVHNLTLPGMLHARIVRPPFPRGRLIAFEEPDSVEVVREGSFLAVVAADEVEAIRAAQAVGKSARWEQVGGPLPPSDDLAHHMKAMTGDTEELTSADIPDGELTVRAAYSRPFLAHASMGPSCAVARWSSGRLQVWCASQGIFRLRSEFAHRFGLPESDVVVNHREGAGCYGHNGADDAAFEAALVARHFPDTPVRLQWMRNEEGGWEPFGPAARAEMEATMKGGGIVGWRCDLWSYGAGGRPDHSRPGPNLWAADQIDLDGAGEAARLAGATRNLEPGYAVGSADIRAYHVDDPSMRTSSLRGLGAHTNVFSIESFMDELAEAAGADPVDFRLRHLEDERGRAVIERVAADAGWGRDLPSERGLGIGYARYKNEAGYCAVVAEVEASTYLRLVKLFAAVDVGTVVNPDGTVNQVAGGMIQTASWTTKEEVRFDRQRILSDTWETYPILTFEEVPEVSVSIVPRPGVPSEGAGELTQGPTAAAIANALYAAIGVRVRDMPIDQEAILAALDAV